MAKALEPPDILAQLCAVFHAWETRGWLEPAVDRAEAVLGSEPIGPPTPESGLASRWRDVSRRITRLGRRVPPGDGLFREALELLHALDRWHEAITDPLKTITTLQDRVRTRFKASDRSVHSYNPNIQFGMIIPPWSQSEERSSPGSSILAQLLDHTAYLPREIAAGDADQPQKIRGRRVRLCYRRGPSWLPVEPGDDRPIIALAPVLEEPGDATIALNGKDEAYGVSLHYDWRRIEEIFDLALESGARILLMPEMTIRHADASRLMKLFKHKLIQVRENGDIPSLLYVIAGLVAGRDESGKTGRNEIALFHASQDETAEPFLCQAKLCRWNLDKHAQEDFLHRTHCKLLKEDIEEGREIYVTDLPGVGRTLTLICADMEADQPGHWLIRNIGVDWLYAPIMDRTIAHRVQMDSSGASQLKPWVVDRAAVAVRQGATRAVVVNSLALTYVNNDTLVPRSYLPFTRCGWAFMLDGSDPQPRYREIDSALPVTHPTRPLVCTIRWLDEFAPAPPEMA